MAKPAQRARIALVVLVVGLIAVGVWFGRIRLQHAITHSAPSDSGASQQQLPLNLSGFPEGVAVDAAGNVYVTESYVSEVGKNRVLKLSAGATSPTTLPFTGLLSPEGVAVDAAGNIYVADFRNLDATSTHQGRVLRLAAGATTATELPFADLNGPQGVAVDRAGNVYVADSGNRRVLKLPAGATSAVELPFTGLHGPVGIAVDEGGNVYVTDVDINTAGRAFKLAPGATAAAELPFTAPMQLYRPRSIAVDAAGGVYVTSSDELDMVKAQSSPYPKQVFHDASLDLSGVTVDNTGNIYIADRLGKRVVKLPPDNS